MAARAGATFRAARGAVMATYSETRLDFLISSGHFSGPLRILR